MELSSRGCAILQIVVEAYINDAQPVSSAAIARLRGDLKLSSATIRNVMVELEEAGLLHQPHTSAGRVPTELGMRVYLNSCVSPKLHPWDRTHLEAATTLTTSNTLPISLGQSLAGLSGQMAVVAVPRFLAARVREIGIVRCDAKRFLTYLVSPSGFVQQKLVEMDFDLTSEEIVAIQNYLNERMANRTLSEIRQLIETELQNDQASFNQLQSQALALGTQVLPAVEVELFIEGASHLVSQPEFADVAKLRALWRTLEEKGALLKLLDKMLVTNDVQTTVLLSSEHHIREVSDLAWVGCTIAGSAGHKTTIGLLGPTRMDYGRLVPMVQYATQLFGRYWEQF